MLAPGLARAVMTTSAPCWQPTVRKTSSGESVYGRSFDRYSATALCFFINYQSHLLISVRKVIFHVSVHNYSTLDLKYTSGEDGKVLNNVNVYGLWNQRGILQK
jgi:hypothetical protein